MNSIDQLRLDLNHISDERTLFFTQVATGLDVLCFFILTTLSAPKICVIPLIGLVGIWASRKKSEKLLNVQFVYGLSSITLRIILTTVYNDVTGVVWFGILSLCTCFASTIMIYKSSIIIGLSPDSLESTPQPASAADPV